jgi:hypothetical protein
MADADSSGTAATAVCTTIAASRPIYEILFPIYKSIPI